MSLVVHMSETSRNPVMTQKYSWIGPLGARTRNINSRTIQRRATTISRPPLESSWQGKSKYSGFSFVWPFFGHLFFKTCGNWASTNLNPKESDSPRQMLSCQSPRSFGGASVYKCGNWWIKEVKLSCVHSIIFDSLVKNMSFFDVFKYPWSWCTRFTLITRAWFSR